MIDGQEKWIFHRIGYERGYYGGWNDERYIVDYSDPGWFGFPEFAFDYAYDDTRNKSHTPEECWKNTYGGDTTEKWNRNGGKWSCEKCKYSSDTFTSFIQN